MTLLHPGFADPVHDSQRCFRALLDAIARPGTVHAVAGPLDPPPPLHPATAAAILTLVDTDTPFALDPAAQPAAEWIAFHTGATPAPLARAAFALALTPIPLLDLNAGTDDAPEDGATLILQVRSLQHGPTLRLHGPGLAQPTLCRIDGLAPDFAAQWAKNRARFPRGIDLVLCSHDRLAAFPRTLTVEEA